MMPRIIDRLSIIFVFTALTWESRADGQKSTECDRDPLGECVAPPPKQVRVTIEVAPITSHPDQIRVRDGRNPDVALCDQTPCRAGLVVDSRPLQVILEARTPNQYATERIQPDAEHHVTAKLSPCPVLDFGTRPPAATVSLNGTFLGPLEGVSENDLVSAVGEVPSPGCNLPFGSYRFLVKADGYQEWQKELIFEKRPGADPLQLRQALEIAMRPVRGSLLVIAPVRGVEVLVDGVPKGHLQPSVGQATMLAVNDVAPGEREVALRFPEQSLADEPALWGTFERRKKVRLTSGGTQVVEFRLPTREAPTFPGRYRVGRESLDRLCPASPAACLGLGWSLHGGIEGPRDDVEAAKRFALVCRDTGEESSGRSISEWILQRKHADHRRAACMAYRWLVDVGAAEADPEIDAVAQSTLAGLCAHPPSPSQTIAVTEGLTECVQSRLDRTAERAADPILSMSKLDLLDPVSAFVSSVAFLTEKNTYATLGVGLYAPLLYSGDLELLVGTSTSYGSTTLVTGGQLAVSFYLMPHVYVPLGAALLFQLTGKSGDLFGVHTGLRWTQGRLSDSGLFMELSGGVAATRVAAPPGPSAEATQEDNAARALLNLPPAAPPADSKPRLMVVPDARLSIGCRFGY